MSDLNVFIAPSSDEIEPFHSLNDPAKPVADGVPAKETGVSNISEDEAESDGMMFSSSPISYPLSSSPPAVTQRPKRKLFQTLSALESIPKRARYVGGFELDEEDEEGVHEPEKEVSQPLQPEQTGSLADERHDGPTDQTGVAQVEQASNTDSNTGRNFHDLPDTPASLHTRLVKKTAELRTCSGATFHVPLRTRQVQKSYEETIAQRSVSAAGRAKTAYYGIDIHKLIDEAKIQKQLDEAAEEVRIEQEPLQSIEEPASKPGNVRKASQTYQMWTEKYRAKKFTDLVGDERTHRSVLRWLKAWDPVVFPGHVKAKAKRIYEDRDFDHDRQHRKILLLTGPPGLGKTTLAHVCAKQAGYEVLEINASDDRSRDVVKGRIKNALGTETVRGIQEQGKARRAGRPVCVIVDEVDGVVTGSSGSGGEGGFMKALVDLVQLDQKNSDSHQPKTKKGDKFRLMRPLIMICNDVYAPSLRPLRNSSLAEVIHVRKPALEKVILRMRTVFEKESIQCDNDAVRRLCETSWGLGTRKQGNLGSRSAGDGDIRCVLVQGEWAAHKLRTSSAAESRLTRKWVEANIGGMTASQKGLGRGGVREVVERVFLEGAGMPHLPTALTQEEIRLVKESGAKPIGVSDLRKRAAITALREMVDTCGEHDRLMTECFATYPTQVFQDDTFLSKPNASYEWLHFHDSLSSRIFSGQEWELNAYLNTGACGFHNLFAAVDRGSRGWNDEKPSQNEEAANTDVHPYAGMKADFMAYEAEKQNRVILTEMQSNFSAPLLRLFSSMDAMATDLVPNVSRMLAPNVKPVVVGGSGGGTSVASVRKDSEKRCVQIAVRTMHGLGIEFEKIRIEHEGGGAHSNGGFAFRMEPPIDVLNTFYFSKAGSSSSSSLSTAITSTSTPIPSAPAPVRYAIRAVLAQELTKEKILQASLARQARVTLPLSLSSSHQTESNNTLNDIERDGDSNKENQGPPVNLIRSTTELIKSKSKSLLASTLPATVKKDFFGRPIVPVIQPSSSTTTTTHQRKQSTSTSTATETSENNKQEVKRTWVSFHEGYSNAVRKYIGLKELMDSF